MINAVLVFNNSGQPRLTKFYTQLASNPPTTSIYLFTYVPNVNNAHSRIHLSNSGSYPRYSPSSPTAPALPATSSRTKRPSPSFYPSPPTPSSSRTLIPPYPQPPSPPRQRLKSPDAVTLATPYRHPLADHLPTLRDALLHPHLYLHRITPRAPRPHPSLCGSPRPPVRKRLRVGSDF